MNALLAQLAGSSPELPANAPRFSGKRGHVESYFWRANDPERPRALWLKATVLAPLHGEPVAEGWFIWFDGERNRTIAGKETVSLSTARYEGQDEAPEIRVGKFAFDVGARGTARGSVKTRAGEPRFDLAWTPDASPIAAPLSLLRLRALREGPFPRGKFLTPFPSLRFTGRVSLPDETVELAGWTGMQGHNWGPEHSFEYVWGQCVFPAKNGQPEALVEGASGRVKIAGRTTPRMSTLQVRRGVEIYRFDRVLDLWRQDSRVEGDRWLLRMSGPDGEARLDVDATNRPIACLGYANPDGQLSYCLNSKLAKVSLQVQPSRGGAFEYSSEHGGALEFLRREPDARFSEVI